MDLLLGLCQEEYTVCELDTNCRVCEYQHGSIDLHVRNRIVGLGEEFVDDVAQLCD